MEKLKECIDQIVAQMEMIDEVNADAKAMIDSAYDTYSHLGGKVSKKVLKKVAKAIVKDKLENLNDEVQEIISLLESNPNWVKLLAEGSDEEVMENIKNL